jgi:hypothetical protein
MANFLPLSKQNHGLKPAAWIGQFFTDDWVGLIGGDFVQT